MEGSDKVSFRHWLDQYLQSNITPSDGYFMSSIASLRPRIANCYQWCFVSELSASYSTFVHELLFD